VVTLGIIQTKNVRVERRRQNKVRDEIKSKQKISPAKLKWRFRKLRWEIMKLKYGGGLKADD